jgi:hypothetical protein
MKQRLFAALLTATLSATASAAPSNMQPGLWEITTETSMPGMPMSIPPQTMRHCYTAAELSQAQNTVPQSGDASCKIKDYQVKGNTATWTIECSGEAAMRGSGTMTTNATSYSGSMTSVMSHPGGTMEMTSSWRARRIGDCQ